MALAELPALITLLKGISDAQWVKANLNEWGTSWPDPADRTSTGYDNPIVVIGAWSSFSWDSQRGQLMLFGGGHGNYAGNEMYLWSGSTRLWGRGSLPSKVTGISISGTPVFMPIDGAFNGPPSMHMYDNTNYLAASDRNLIFNGPPCNNGNSSPVKPDGSGGYLPTGPYLWDPSKADPAKVGGTTGSAMNPAVVGGNMWQDRDVVGLFQVTTFAGTFGLGQSDGTSAAAVEGGKDVVYFTGRGSGTVYLMKYTINDVSNPALDTMAAMGGTHSTFGPYGAAGLDTRRNFYIALGENTAQKFIGWAITGASNINTHAVALSYTVTGGLTFPVTGTSTQVCGIDYDSALDCFMVWDGAGDVWKLAPPANNLITGTWTLTRTTEGATISAGSKPANMNVAGVRGKWHFIPNINAFMALEGDTDDGNVWLYRPPGWVAPSFLTVQESGSDTAAFIGGTASTGTLAAVETGSDAARFGPADPYGTLESVELDSDTATLAGTLPISGTVAAVETGSDLAEIIDSFSSEIWSYTLPNGMAAADCAASMVNMMTELHLLKGLDPAEPLSETDTQRSAGSILLQLIAGLPTTVTRQ